MMPSFQSDGTCPVLQTDRKMEWSALATGGMANFSSSAAMPSGNGVPP